MMQLYLILIATILHMMLVISFVLLLPARIDDDLISSSIFYVISHRLYKYDSDEFDIKHVANTHIHININYLYIILY